MIQIKMRPIDMRIIKMLLESDYYLTTLQISKGASISWNTAERHLKELFKKGWVYKKEAGRTAYWKARIANNN